jgi:hypothetical protein
MLSLVTGLLEEGNAKGEISARDPELVALLLLAGLRGVLRFGKRPRPRDLAQRIVDIFLKGAVLEAKDGKHFSTDPSLYSEASVIG